MQDFFCSLPWTGLDVSPQGSFKPCCKYANVIANDLDSYLSSQHLQALRQDFLDHKRPAGCHRCWKDEDAGLPSKRQLDQQYVLGDDRSRDAVKVLAMTFGNTCNLACVTCYSGASSRWAQEESRMSRSYPTWQFGSHGHAKFYRDPEFIQQLLSVSDQLIHLEISGGEPFYASADIHKTFLKSLPNPHKIKIHYITNATVFPDEEFWEIWKDFRHIDIQLSLDAVHKRFEYLRYPADWSQVAEHVRRYQQHDHIQISISHTVSWLNVLYLPEFFDWCRDQQLPDPYLGPVTDPVYLSPKCLPLTAKSNIRDRLIRSDIAAIQSMINYMDQEDLSAHWPRAMEWIHMLDTTRSLDINRVFPELTSIITNAI